MHSMAKRTSASISYKLIDQVRHGRIQVDAALPTERELCEIFAASSHARCRQAPARHAVFLRSDEAAAADLIDSHLERSCRGRVSASV